MMITKTTFTESKIYSRYTEKTPESARKYQRARELFPSGVTHLIRYLRPHPLFVERALGPLKWDVDGNEYVDYLGGHGALILGHSHPEVVEAVQAQVSRGTHFGAEHEWGVEWASLISEMVPSAERVRFTSSGTEATQLGLRIARAYTRKPKFVRFGAHFHGWHDQVAFSTPGEGTNHPAGIPAEVVDQAIILEPNDVDALEIVLASRDDVAAVILEPTGAGFGRVPTGGETLRAIREITKRYGALLMFDEVITGFRCSPGGAQTYYGVTPDLTALAKIVAGGYPGGAITGRADVMSVLYYEEGDNGVTPPAVPHQGTFNAAPVSAVAGITTLKLLRSGEVIATANDAAARIRDEMNNVLERLGIHWCVYGEFSAFHIYTNPGGEAITPRDVTEGRVGWEKLKSGTPMELMHKLRLGFLCEGVDISTWPGGVTSGVHGPHEVDRTLSAFEKVLRTLREEGDCGS
jgi:glutamate-1-semialdehyde 2,1-aminomutase